MKGCVCSRVNVCAGRSGGGCYQVVPTSSPSLTDPDPAFLFRHLGSFCVFCQRVIALAYLYLLFLPPEVTIANRRRLNIVLAPLLRALRGIRGLTLPLPLPNKCKGL